MSQRKIDLQWACRESSENVMHLGSPTLFGWDRSYKKMDRVCYAFGVSYIHYSVGIDYTRKWI